MRLSKRYLSKVKNVIMDELREGERFGLLISLNEDGLYECAVIPGGDMDVFVESVRQKVNEEGVDRRQILYVYHNFLGQKLGLAISSLFERDVLSLNSYFKKMKVGNGNERYFMFELSKGELIDLIDRERENLRRELVVLESYYSNLMSGLEGAKELLQSISSDSKIMEENESVVISKMSKGMKKTVMPLRIRMQ